MDDEYYEQDNRSSTGDRQRETLLERLTRQSLGDVRIHNSRQAGELARRLGARAFTVGRDVYLPPEIAQPLTPQGSALLAHEMTHVAEQTGVSQPMPVLKPSASGTPVQRQAEQSVQRATPGQTSSEARAEAAEAAAMREAEAARRKKKPAPPDPEVVADRVYLMMMKEITLSSERG